MEFLLFLSQSEKEIVELIYKAGYSIEENTPLCLIGTKFFGFLKKDQKKVVICTKNAMQHGGYYFSGSKDPDENFQTGLMIRRAIRHESVHIAQECNNGKLLNMKGNKISPYKTEALKASVKLTGQEAKEYEAYALEDNPKKVKSALKKYCL